MQLSEGTKRCPTVVTMTAKWNPQNCVQKKYHVLQHEIMKWLRNEKAEENKVLYIYILYRHVRLEMPQYVSGLLLCIVYANMHWNEKTASSRLTGYIMIYLPIFLKLKFWKISLQCLLTGGASGGSVKSGIEALGVPATDVAVLTPQAAKICRRCGVVWNWKMLQF